jgi:hypothetical protein
VRAAACVGALVLAVALPAGAERSPNLRPAPLNLHRKTVILQRPGRRFI